MRRLTAILLSVHLAVTISSLAGTRRDDVADINFINLGADPLYSSVGRFTYSVGSSSYIASGVLISPDWVLTAAHVVEGNNFLGGGITNMTFSLTAGSSTFVYTAMQWIPHPGWAVTSANVFAGFDIGLVRLSSQTTAVNPATLYASPLTTALPATIVGYGSSGTGSTGFLAGTAGTKRAGQNMIEATGDNYSISSGILFADFDDPLDPAKNIIGSPTPLPLEYSPAPGDSGGGLFVTQGVNTYLMGITSFGWGFRDNVPDASYGDLAGFVAVSPHLSWIQSTIAPVTVMSVGAAVPEPGTWIAAAGLVLLAVARYRRGSRVSRRRSPR